MMDSNMKVVVIGALPADRVAPSRSYLIVNGERVSYAHLVYYRGGLSPTQCGGHFQTLIAERDGEDMGDTDERERA